MINSILYNYFKIIHDNKHYSLKIWINIYINIWQSLILIIDFDCFRECTL